MPNPGGNAPLLRIEPTLTIKEHALFTSVVSGDGKYNANIPKTGQQEVQIYYEDDPLCPSRIYYLSMVRLQVWAKLARFK